MNEWEKTLAGIERAGGHLMQEHHAGQCITAAKDAVMQMRQLANRATGERLQAINAVRLTLCLSELRDMGLTVKLGVEQ
jgi:hypothetical protein